MRTGGRCDDRVPLILLTTRRPFCEKHDLSSCASRLRLLAGSRRSCCCSWSCCCRRRCCWCRCRSCSSLLGSARFATMPLRHANSHRRNNERTNELAYNQQSGAFSEDMIPTVGFNMKKVSKGNVTIKLWDIGGQPRFRSMWERYCRGVNAIV